MQNIQSNSRIKKEHHISNHLPLFIIMSVCVRFGVKACISPIDSASIILLYIVFAITLKSSPVVADFCLTEIIDVNEIVVCSQD